DVRQVRVRVRVVVLHESGVAEGAADVVELVFLRAARLVGETETVLEGSDYVRGVGSELGLRCADHFAESFPAFVAHLCCAVDADGFAVDCYGPAGVFGLGLVGHLVLRAARCMARRVARFGWGGCGSFMPGMAVLSGSSSMT